MKVLVTGGTGFTGRKVVGGLVGAGHHVTCLVRPTSDRSVLAGNEVTFVTGDLADPEGLGRALAGHDALMNVASLGFGHAPGIVSAMRRSGVQRGVFFSTTAVFTTLPARSREARLAAEDAVRDSGLDWTILRPTMIYGAPGDRNVERLLAALLRWPALPVPAGGGRLIQPVVVDDLASATVRALSEPAAVNRCYTLAGREPVSFTSFVRGGARALGRRTALVPVPRQLALAAAALLCSMTARSPVRPEQVARLLEDKDFRIAAARADLAYEPMGVEQGLALEVARMGGAS